MNSDLKQTYKRMLIGAGIGFSFLFAISSGLMYMNGWFDASVNQYSGPPPLMTTIFLGFIGLIFGAIIGLLNLNSPYIVIFCVILLGGVLPLLPREWFRYFPGWFEKVVLLFGLIFIVLSLIPSNKNKSKETK